MSCTPRGCVPETGGQGGTRQAIELADAFQAEPYEELYGLRVETQGGDRKLGNQVLCLSRPNDHPRLLWSHPAETGDRMRSAEGIGEADMHRETDPPETISEVGAQLRLATKEMRHARDIDPGTVVPIYVRG